MNKPKVSVVAVALNEGKSILKVLKLIPKDVVDEILVVDGHSKDDTVKIAKDAGYNVILQEGKGRGAAFQTGFKKVNGDVVVMLSTDGNERPGDIRKLVERINEGNDLVIATRFGKGKSEDVTFIRIIGNWCFTKMCSILGRVKITDSMNGFRALRKDALDKMNIQSQRFDIEGEITMKAGKLKMRVSEIPTIEDSRDHGDSRLHTFRDGYRIMKTIWKEYRNNPPY